MYEFRLPHHYFTWDGNRLLNEIRGEREQTYLYEQDGFVPVATLKDGEINYYHTDHLGTPQELTNQKGEIVWEAEYATWGNTVKVNYKRVDANIQEDVALQPLRFQGQYYDAETGLHYNRFRYYDPDVGRFTTQDPIGLLGGDNLYAYAPNPIIWFDVYGLWKKHRLNGQFAKKPGPKPKKDSTHGNSKNNSKCTSLYKLTNEDGSFSKWGITSEENPLSRYSSTELGTRKMTVVATGSRVQMLVLERLLVESHGGPENKESWKGKSSTQLTPEKIMDNFKNNNKGCKII